MGKHVLAVAALAALAWGRGASADDGAALADRLLKQPFDGSRLENGSQFLDAGHSGVGADLGSYGVVGVSWLRMDDRDGGTNNIRISGRVTSARRTGPNS